MRTLSLFQILPSHVVELIVSHVAGSSRLLFDGVAYGSEEYAALLMPLQSVCRDFRAAVLARYCKIYTLDLTCFSDQGNDKKLMWPERLRGIGFPTHLHAQELDITLGVFSVYNGTALKELLREPHSDYMFSMVRSLKVTLTQTTREKRLLASIPAAQDIEPNIRDFVQRIRLITPMTKKVCISLQSRSVNESQFVAQHFGSLVAQLHQLGNTIEHKYDCRPMRLELPPTGISSLVHMDWRESNGDMAMQLARHNAPTLRTLKIYLRETESISHLIQNVNGNSVQYPCLRVLVLADWPVSRYDQWTMEERVPQQPLPVFPGETPFPNLRHLGFGGSYPFGDDTLFRGNAYTLEYLHVDLCSRVVRILREYQVFTHSSHPKLQHVRLLFESDRLQALFDTDVSLMKFALSIGPNARVRELHDCQLALPFQYVIPLLGEYTCIQVLSIPFMSMDLWSIIALVKSLPLLTDLHTQFSKPETWPSGVFNQHLPTHVIANYAPMGERFRCWQLVGLNGMEVKVAVKCVLLLALVCPNFDYAAVPAGNRELFMAYLKKAINIDQYNMAKTVRPLLWVSERWRVAALSIICDNCEINFDNTPKGFSMKYPALPDSFSFTQYRMEKLVKRVVVTAPSWSDICSGRFSSTPSGPEFDFPIFPSAATLMVCLDENDVNPPKAGRGVVTTTSAVPADRNLETIRFVQSIRRLAPAATGVVVFFRSPSSTNKKNRGLCNTLVLQLCHGRTTRLYVQSWTECTLSMLKLRSMSGLTTITQGVDTSCVPFAQLAYLNANTLKQI
ncbi:hypothetical protein GGI19_003546 [Coemansia pectinata]|uniref:Uncharacterized protein n=1 Tax=Coemansia pectinata TaxID=1052879 RepID=A0A9W8GVD6_9FUNG|nr:hypothetical protein GGI19_003546 [Coemansia pectinata]